MTTMVTTANASFPSPTIERPSKAAMPNAVLGMLIFILTEVMFFTALVSAHMVIRSGAGAVWFPPLDVRLPVAATAFNTFVLLASGLMVFFSGRQFARRNDPEDGKMWLTRSQRSFANGVVLGLFFVLFQGYEWVNLIKYGMTMKSGIFGAMFFLLIGSHGLHALCAVLVLIFAAVRLSRDKLRADQFQALRYFWYFVVSIWPVLYGLVYF